jgi:hypothetical protein
MAPGKVNVRPFRTNGSCGAYLTCIKLKSYTSVLYIIIAYVFAKSLMLQLACPADWIFIDSYLTMTTIFLQNNMVILKSKVNCRSKHEGVYMEVMQLNFSL